MRKIYVDFAATTPVDPRVLEAMQPFFGEKYGNASSLNSFGVEAKKALEQSRETMTRFMNADPDEVIFTGSATEANNLVLKGHALKEGKEKCHLAVSLIDHDCVLNSARWLEKAGYKVTFLPVDQYGFLKKEDLEKALEKKATLVSVVHGNNEIGTIQEAEETAKKCHESGALFHTDAVQTFGKTPINVKTASFDFMTINAHKIYGPKGVGALYIRKGLRLEPLIHGGGHEFGLRSGTENIPGIIGFAKAMELRKEEMEPERDRLTLLRDKLIKETLEIEDSYLNGPSTRRLYNNVNIRFSFIEGESIVLALDTEGIAASSGSACSSTSGEASHVLLAIGLKPEEARGSLRLSLGKYNTQDDVDYILEILPQAIRRLRAMSPLNRNSKRASGKQDSITRS
ncbi:MAG: aminotransferase class V-fold PLP-dependent enzyme [Candidatus Bathyarchaeota archaeon]|nr:aminotransferase class V-fold PLP-dependent enzyme [Candidatus Bathyarchaeota archaeon]